MNMIFPDQLFHDCFVRAPQVYDVRGDEISRPVAAHRSHGSQDHILRLVDSVERVPLCVGRT